jgi:beta-glucosidase
MVGGSALADILWGDYNPAGRLPISVPHSVGQIPVYYSQPSTGDYVEESAKPLFPFGYGLSYTQFEYSDLQVESVSKMDTVCRITCTVKNIGPCDGDEVVQLYVRDEVASIAPASKLLKGFQRVHINKGEAKQVVFYLTERDLSVYSVEKGWHLEPGEFTILVGGNSEETISKNVTIK